MDKLNFFRWDLILHLIGITALGGSALVSFILFRPFLKPEAMDLEQGLVVLNVQKILSRVAAAGLGIQIISGILLITATGGGYGAQLWFKLKMLLVLLIFIGSLLLSRVLLVRLRARLTGNEKEFAAQPIKKLAGSISAIQVLLLSFILAIFLLAVFKIQ